MHGDLSWPFRNSIDNLIAPVDQQGRVLSDRDGNARTALATRWYDEAARSAFGAGVAAVPSYSPHGFEVVAAAVNAGIVRLDVDPGLMWADGLLAYLVGDPAPPNAPVHRIATPLGPPLQPLPQNTGTGGTRDAVVLELWRETLSAFQMPERLLEPALGGPDTSLRLQTAMAFRLFRMADGDTCDSIRDRLADDFSQRGKLTATLAPTTVVSTECPEIQGGGYTGFEHNLYRIEIAELTGGAPGPMFKWSQQNGGLVGRGRHDAPSNKIIITANDQAILRSDQAQFYLEILDLDDDYGYWRPVFGSRVTLGSDDELALSGPPLLGTAPPPSTAQKPTFFFRLWNDIRPINDFPSSATNELRDGIRLQFDTSTGDNYVPGDFWTFTARAGGIINPDTLVDHAPPEGIVHHRVALAEIDWPSAGPATIDKGAIHDCRTVFPPLGESVSCCTFRVGPHGDFTTIQAAVNALPDASGGRICVMPGDYEDSVVIEGKRDILITGCRFQTSVRAKTPSGEFNSADPVFWVKSSTNITIEHMVVIAGTGGIGVLLEELPPPFDGPGVGGPLDRILLEGLEVHAATASAIEQRGGSHVTIRACNVIMDDVQTLWPAVTLRGEDGLVERNSITAPPGPSERTREMRLDAGAGLGGLWLRGGCVRIRVIDNLIEGGIAHGIILGDVQQGTVITAPTGGPTRFVGNIGWIFDANDDCAGCVPGSGDVPPSGGGQPPWVAGDPLEDIWIEHNRIFRMGLDGIGVYGFFADTRLQGIITVVGLTIIGNVIRGCLRRPLARVRENMLDRMGYGAIALADVEKLAANDNVLEDNGPDHLLPVCGIFALHAVGAEISRNRIVNNGARNEKGDSQALRGPRGGIYLTMAVSPVLDSQLTTTRDARSVPAATIHDNVVDAPLGHAVFAIAIGPISIVANSLTTRGVGPDPLQRFGAAVLVYETAVAWDNPGVGFFTNTSNVHTAAILIRPPLGHLLVANNQIVLLANVGRGQVISSIFLISADDTSFQDNQSLSISVPLLTHLIVWSVTLRVVNNRLQEGRGDTSLSGITSGGMNITAHNESTHRLFASGTKLVSSPNLNWL
jgi:hypothetical protein